MRRLVNFSGTTIIIFLVWKVGLLLFTSQPVPANDSFFYDGPVVNYLLHGKYCNPSLAQVLPISGNEVFCAYPPLYQVVLLGWMKVFGTSAAATLWLHVTLLGAFVLTVLRIFQQLQVAAWAVNLAGLFLFGLTFHDRPDTLAHLLGALALLAWVQGLMWPVAVFLLLTIATSLQIGGIYSLWIAMLTLGGVGLGKIKMPFAPALLLASALVGLVALVKFGHPHIWEGFQEHVKITPAVTGIRTPSLDDILKVVRTAPGIALVLAGVIWILFGGGNLRGKLGGSPGLLMAVTGGLTAVALIGGCLFVLTPNLIHVASYMQPVLVGCFLAALAGKPEAVKSNKMLQVILIGAALLVAIRAIGMTTWGVVCARDVSCGQALARVNAELDAVPDGANVFVSSAYLYEAAKRTNLTWIHTDWPALAEGHDWETRAVLKLKPTKLLLTQFDYYRRFGTVITRMSRERTDVEVRITDLVRVKPPDAMTATRKLVQHISWAPVIVELKWKDEPVPK